MIDSIASNYTDMKQAEVQQQAGMSVLKKGLDLMESQGAQMVALLNSSAAPAQQVATDPALGSIVDIRA